MQHRGPPGPESAFSPAADAPVVLACMTPKRALAEGRAAWR
jgi:hypothetical protein